MDDALITVSYSIAQAASYLGMATVKLRTLIDQGVIPAPYLREPGGDGTRYYSVGELKVIDKILRKYNGYGHNSYIRAEHDLHQHLQAYRESNV